MPRIPLRDDQRGFTMVEVMVAAVILLVGVLGTVALIDGANAATTKNQRREAGTNLTRQVVEGLQRLTSTALDGDVTDDLQAVSGLTDADSGTAGWQLDNRGVRFNVTATACSLDDPSDGLGARPAGISWCPGTAGTADSQPQDMRRVTVIATPASGGGTPLTQTVVVGPRQGSGLLSGGTTTTTTTTGTTGTTGTTTGGSGASVNVVNLNSVGCASTATGTFLFGTNASGNTGCYQTAWTNAKYLSIAAAFCASSCTTNINGIGAVKFTASTTAAANTVKWSLDGVVKGNATNTGGNNWSFVWDLADTYPNQTVDGGYDVSAQAFDAGGTSLGPPAKISFVLQRFYPDGAAWGAPVGGWNPRWTQAGALNASQASGAGTMEIEWFPTGSTAARADRDLAGFQVQRCTVSSCGYVFINNCDPGYATGGFSPGTLTSYTYCRDTGIATSSTIGNYRAVMADRLWDGTLNGAHVGLPPQSGDLIPATANRAPNPPTSLIATSSTTDVTLTWTVPTGTGDLDASDCVDFFRIYRTPSTSSAPTLPERYDRTLTGVVDTTNCGNSTATTSWVDAAPCSGTCKYWITAVDRKLAESVVVGPASGGI